MSTAEYYTRADGVDFEGLGFTQAFDAAVENRYDRYGTEGARGSVAEASGVILVSDVPVLECDALVQAEHLLSSGDTRFTENGPAGAIALRGGERRRILRFDKATWAAAGNPSYHGDWQKALAATILAEQFPSEKIIAVRASRYEQGRHPILNTPIRPTHGELDVITTGTTDRTGWLLFGRAYE